MVFSARKSRDKNYEKIRTNTQHNTWFHPQYLSTSLCRTSIANDALYQLSYCPETDGKNPRACLKIRKCRVAGDFSPDQRRSGEKETQSLLWARARKAVWQRYLLGQSPLRGFSLAGALPSNLSCSRTTFPNFQTGSKSTRRSPQGNPSGLTRMKPRDK